MVSVLAQEAAARTARRVSNKARMSRSGPLSDIGVVADDDVSHVLQGCGAPVPVTAVGGEGEVEGAVFYVEVGGAEECVAGVGAEAAQVGDRVAGGFADPDVAGAHAQLGGVLDPDPGA